MAILSFSLSQNALSSRLQQTQFLKVRDFQPSIRINCSAYKDDEKVDGGFKELRNVACGFLAVWAVSNSMSSFAGSQRLPPLSTDPKRCEQAFVGNTIGQANGVYDKPIDLRFCDYTNEKDNLKGKSLAAALMSGAKFDGADMSEVVMSKAYAVGASFQGVDFTNAVLDRVVFDKANLKGASFKNTVLSGSTFTEAQLEDVVFEDTIIGYIDLQKLCRNTTITEDGRAELGCRHTHHSQASSMRFQTLPGNKTPTFMKFYGTSDDARGHVVRFIGTLGSQVWMKTRIFTSMERHWDHSVLLVQNTGTGSFAKFVQIEEWITTIHLSKLTTKVDE